MGLLSTQLPFPQLLTKWSSVLNPLISNPLNSVTILPRVSLVTGKNVINTLLGTMQTGWIILDIDAPVTVYRSEPFNTKTLTLTSSGDASILIGVF